MLTREPISPTLNFSSHIITPPSYFHHWQPLYIFTLIWMYVPAETVTGNISSRVLSQRISCTMCWALTSYYVIKQYGVLGHISYGHAKTSHFSLTYIFLLFKIFVDDCLYTCFYVCMTCLYVCMYIWQSLTGHVFLRNIFWINYEQSYLKKPKSVQLFNLISYFIWM